MAEIDPKLLEKINQALHQTLMTMVRSVVSIGATPQTVISMIRERLDMIESMVKETERATTDDATVRDAGDDGTPWRHIGGAIQPEPGLGEVVQKPEAAEQPADVRRKRGVQPPNQAEYFGEWSDDDTANYGIEPRTGPGLDPREPF